MQVQEVRELVGSVGIDKLASLKCQVDVIKYRNRKMYLKALGTYMNLEQMDKLYRAGCDIRVKCARLKIDITEEALRALAVWRIGGLNREQIVDLLENNL